MNNKEVIKNLESKDQLIVMNTLKHIAKDGNKDILNSAIKLLVSNQDTLIRDEVVKILDNLKNQDCAVIVINAIHNKEFKSELPILVSSCWKNGLNFEEYLETFVDIFIHAEFQLAFDAFTVIDTFEQANQEMIDKSLIKLNNATKEIKDDKKALHNELIKLIKDLKENPAK